MSERGSVVAVSCGFYDCCRCGSVMVVLFLLLLLSARIVLCPLQWDIPSLSLWLEHDGVVPVVVAQCPPSFKFFAVGCSEFV